MESWAIIVGINRYPDHTGQPELKGAVADACDFADWALDPAGGNVAPQRLFFWTHPWPADAEGRLSAYLASPLPQWDHDEDDWAPPETERAPRAQQIVLTAERTGRKAYEDAYENGDQARRRIYVFLAGHGLRAAEVGDSNIQTCFVARNFRPRSSHTADGLIGCESFRKSLLNNRFDEVVMFLDCCRVDGTLLARSAIPICDRRNYRGDGIWSTGYASRDNTLAFETEHPPVRGVFSKTLLEGLRGHRDGSTNSLNAEQLNRYVLDNICFHTHRQQFPQFFYMPTDNPLVLVNGVATVAPKFAPGPAVHLDRLPPGTRVFLRDGRSAFVPGIGPLVAGNGPIQLPPLPDGLYSLEVVDNTDLHATFRQPRDKVVYVGH